MMELVEKLRSWWPGQGMHVWYSPDYRLPLARLDARVGFETRRADLALWTLKEMGALRPQNIHEPARILYAELARVHEVDYLESLGRPEVLAHIFGVDDPLLPVDEVMRTVRLACGGTLAAARWAWRRRRQTLNLLGGFHHAQPALGSGLCPVNDIAVAIACLRMEGLRGQVAVLDLDAHPPDGLAACLRDDPLVWIGSLSGSDWGPLEGVDETLLPEGCGDWQYLEALEALLERAPEAELTFVIAGGDVLQGDHMGLLGMTLEGARQRDLMVLEHLGERPAVWLPGGGYNRRSWKVLAGTGLAIALGSSKPIPESFSPMSARFAALSASLETRKLEGDALLTEDDLAELLGPSRRVRGRLLGYYTLEGAEYALSRFGILEHLRRLGFRDFRIALSGEDRADKLRLFGTCEGFEYMLIEAVLEKREVVGRKVLYVHWLTLRNPRADFSDKRPRLPGQEVPGLGLALECGEMLARMALRLGLEGVAFQPAHCHVAYTARKRFRFANPERQGRFEAMLRDLGHMPLIDLTCAVDEGRVRMDGEPYVWEPEAMVFWLEPREADLLAAEAVSQRVRFEVVEGASEV